jgi:1-acyl-sn-glycerol-3-phosphate acyltransferase
MNTFLRFILPFFAVVVDLSDARKAMRSVRSLLGLVRDTNAHITMFPEGARFTDGAVHEFMSGFVTLAKKTDRPVVPVCILGVHKAYPPNTFWVQWFPISVIIGKPFIYSTEETDEEFKARVFDWFVKQTGQEQ